MKNLTTAGLLTGLITMALFGCSKDDDDSTNSKYPLLVTGKIWSVGAFVHYPDSVVLGLEHFDKIGSDTIMEGIKWYKYYTSRDEGHDNFWLNGFLREDSSKIYYKQPGFAPWLLYDFNLNTGDEIQLNSYVDSEYLPYCVYSVDSVKYLPVFNHEKRKHIFLSPKNNTSSEYVVWIEGIGSNCGIWDSDGNYGKIGAARILLCCKENGTYIYQDTTNDVCYLGPND